MVIRGLHYFTHHDKSAANDTTDNPIVLILVLRQQD